MPLITLSFALLLLTPALTAAQQSRSCAGRDTQAEWVQRCGGNPDLGFYQRGASACSDQYYKAETINPLTETNSAQVRGVQEACDRCNEATRGTSFDCNPVCQRAPEINIQYGHLYDEIYCRYTECVVSSPCPNYDLCDNVYNLCQLAADVAHDPTVAAGATVARLCSLGFSSTPSPYPREGVFGIGSLSSIAKRLPIGVVFGSFLRSCKTTGQAIKSIGKAAEVACTSCNAYLAKLGCSERAICSAAPNSSRKKRQDDEGRTPSITADDATCGSDTSINVSDLGTDNGFGCAEVAATLETVYFYNSTAMGDIGPDIENLPSSAECQAVQLIQGFIDAKAVVGDTLWYQSKPCYPFDTAEEPSPSQARRRRRMD
ncbi:hypothetical protein I317_05054 [Kwoniella heveanensis CBS 569]|nr:hypothetical protein I317_05054 [Kwoniella heveanensis CBS 569]